MLITLPLVASSCATPEPYPRDEDDARLFGPAAMRVHPIFTQVKDWTGDGKSDGIEALVELQDQFGDPTKASGRILFELFDYRAYDPEPRGARLAYWNADLGTLEDQRQRWNRTSRTYGFTLAYDSIRDDKPYVLAATFELSGGGRFFDRIILEPKAPKERPGVSSPSEPTTQPTTAP
jgi:hypothetical protein